MEVKSPYAVAYLAQAPGELGLARAYVSGHIDVHGDMYTALDRDVAAHHERPDRCAEKVARRLRARSACGRC